MFDLETTYGYDAKLADAGEKMKLGADPEEYIQLRYLPNADYRSMLGKEHRFKVDILKSADASTADKISEEILSRVLSRTCVTGWGKKFCMNGEILKFSPDKCMEVFIKYPKFRMACQAWAEDHTNFRVTPEVELGK